MRPTTFMSARVIVKDGYCDACSRAKNLLASRGIAFTTEVYDRGEMDRTFGVGSLYPKIFIDGTLVSGYSELKRVLEGK